MAAIIEVKYFNSFWLKKVEDTTTRGPGSTTPSKPTWPGLDWNPFGYMTFPINASSSTSGGDPNYLNNWYIEEGRILGGFNEAMVSQGIRAYLNEENPQQDDRQSSLIYSGVYNSRTDINQTNVFSVAEPISKTLDPAYGSVQKLFAEDTNLVIFQENKVSQALIDKDAIYSAEGQGQAVTTNNLVIGQVVPYLGRYGIGKNPESFAQFGFRKYFVDPDRATVMRLSRDGLTEISEYGMKDFFRDAFNSIDNLNKQYKINWTLTDDELILPITVFYIENIQPCNVFVGSKVYKFVGSTAVDTGATVVDIQERLSPSTSPPEYVITVDKPISPGAAGSTGYFSYNYKSRIVGGWDNYNRYYTLSLQSVPSYIDISLDYSTLGYDESVRGWVSFFTYKPSFTLSVKGVYFSTANGSLYRHYTDQPGGNRGVFYGVYNKSTVSFVINNIPSSKKVFQTINYEGDNGWQVSSLSTNLTKVDSSPNTRSADQGNIIRSYNEGLYTDPNSGYPMRAGFERKENLYVANVVNHSLYQNGQVLTSSATSGLKGYTLSVVIETDDTTDYKGAKEIWSVGSTFTQSS